MSIDLYHKMACPFSAKVRNRIDELGVKSKIKYHDIIQNENAMDELMDLTGKTQVPCLVIDGKPLLESDEIIEWLNGQFSSSTKGHKNSPRSIDAPIP